MPQSTGLSATRQLLDSFWEARGVLDPVQRKLLVDAAESLDAEVAGAVPLSSAPLTPDVPLPGVPAAWQIHESAPEVLAASKRLLALQQMLGGGAGGGDGEVLARASRPIDVVWMVVREPQLLSADLAAVTGRLLDMKLATLGAGVDVLRLVEGQPGLLLSDRWRLDLEALQAAQDAAAAEAAAGPRSAMAAYAPAFGSGANPTSSAAASLFSLSLSEAAERSAPPPPVYGEDAAGTAFSDAAAATASGYTLPPPPTDAAVLRNWGSRSSAASTSGSTPDSASAAEQAAVARSSAANGGGATAVSPVEQLVSAWRFGISSDDDTEWAERLQQLSAYASAHGDTSVGFRDGDDRELARWATKQRSDWRRGQLAEERHTALAALGFEFDADEAEWVRWFNQLTAFRREAGHASPMPLVTGADMYLSNWCSVQRIARRSRVMADSRIARLDALGFDWTGADPLS
ncbi:hypothetical protein CHLRE_16g650350v5 [Chlamydomonas reinhardtii]|uniref:Helicase-associated domain-containing protein n=1 Tax=Chlamydomonas reinhardtii TaxID=3055 RepID=A8J9I2_CHLRE|nr:uncharacterized protein CHLRE_16g650350v5 [Chlamydomonas reinhardtii]PNW71343.1 hypothetical protein CHLRE_16g650350v5 [Chlamydomonas reinhardtii]|eukprot:XP_001698248.1 predicted protein [Chlamydomonas reinhardtii]